MTDRYGNPLLVLPSWICSISDWQQNGDYPLHILLLFISFLFACIHPHQAIMCDEYIKLYKIDLRTRTHAYTQKVVNKCWQNSKFDSEIFPLILPHPTLPILMLFLIGYVYSKNPQNQRNTKNVQ